MRYFIKKKNVFERKLVGDPCLPKVKEQLDY